MNRALAVSYGFPNLRLPSAREGQSGDVSYIDLWPLLSGESGWETYTVRL